MNRTLSIEAPAALSRLLIAPSLPRFARQHPGLRVELRDEDPDERLSNGADAAICIAPAADPRLVFRWLAPVCQVTCASHEVVACSGVPAYPSDLAAEHCIALLESRTHRVRDWHFSKGSITHTITPAASLAFSDVASAVQAAVRSAGYVRVPELMAARPIAAGLLCPVLEDWNEVTESLAFVYRGERADDEVIASFAAFVARLLPVAVPAALARTTTRPE